VVSLIAVLNLAKENVPWTSLRLLKCLNHPEPRVGFPPCLWLAAWNTWLLLSANFLVQNIIARWRLVNVLLIKTYRKASFVDFYSHLLCYINCWSMPYLCKVFFHYLSFWRKNEKINVYKYPTVALVQHTYLAWRLTMIKKVVPLGWGLAIALRLGW
jgi:hypothetical protein